MKKQTQISLLLAIFLLNLLTGCMNFFQNSYDEDAKEQEQKIVLNLIVDDFEQEETESRTILPAVEDGSTVSKFVLEGLHAKDSSGAAIAGAAYAELGSWNSYSSFNSARLEVLPGTWSFKLKLYKKESSQDKLFAAADVLDKALVFTDDGQAPYSLSFTLSYGANNTLTMGSCAVKVNVPENILNHAAVSMYDYSGADGTKYSLTLAKSEYTASETGDAAGYKAFTIKENNIPNGYYFLELKFFTDEDASPTATKVEYVKIAGGQTSSANLTYDNLNLRYTVTYHKQLDDTETASMPADFKYNASTNVTLPTAATVVADHYEFKGWYENSDYTGTALTSWNAGDRTDAVNLYAKWAPKKYDVNFYDYKGNQSGAKTFSGTTAFTELYYGDSTQGIQGNAPQITSPALSAATAAALESDDAVTFAGWYSEASCASTSAVTQINASTLHYNAVSGKEEINLYAKWIPKNIYVSATGSDSNNGLTKNSPFATLKEAMAYLSSSTETVRILSTLGVDNSGDNNPSGVSNKALYGNGTDAVVLQRFGFADSLFKITGSDVSFTDMTVDGGAEKYPLLNVNSPLVEIVTGASLTLNMNAVLQNNNNQAAGGKGGAVFVNGTLKSQSASNKFLKNNSESGGGCYIAQTGKVQLIGIEITGNNASYGGGVYTEAQEPNYCVISSATLTNTAASDGNDIYIEAAAGLQIDNCKINTGAGYNIYNRGNLYISGSTVVKSTYLNAGAYIYPCNYYYDLNGTKIEETENELSVDGAAAALTTITVSRSTALPTYDAADSSTYVVVLKERTAGDGNTNAHYQKFKSSVSKYIVNELGYLIYDPLLTFSTTFDADMPEINSDDIEITYSVTGTTLTASAPAAYSTYQWIFNGELLAETTSTMTADVSALGAGTYELIVIAKTSAGQIDTGTVQVRIVNSINAGS